MSGLRSFVTLSIARLVNVAPSAIRPATDLQELGFDSIMGMQLMKEIQETFNVRIYPSEAQLGSTLGALLDYLVEKALIRESELRREVRDQRAQPEDTHPHCPGARVPPCSDLIEGPPLAEFFEQRPVVPDHRLDAAQNHADIGGTDAIDAP